MYHIPAALARSAGAALSALARDPAGVLTPELAREAARAFLAVPVLLGAGIAVYFLLPLEPSWPWMIVAASLPLFLFWALRDTPFNGVGLALLIAVSGFLLSAFRTEIVDTPVLPAEVGPAQLTAVVERVERRPDALRLLVRPEQFGRLRPEHLPARLKLSVRSIDGPVRPGDRVQMLASAQPPSSPAEPGAFDFQRHAFYRGIGGYGFAMGTVRVTPSPDGGNAFNRFRDRLSRDIAAAVGPENGGIAAALITGNRSRVREEQ